MPGRGRADANVYAASQNQGITLGYHRVGADRRGIVQCPRAEAGEAAQSGVTGVGQVTKVKGGPRGCAYRCVVGAGGVVKQRLRANSGISLASIRQERSIADGRVERSL